MSALDSLKNGAKFDMKSFFDGDIEGFSITRNSSGKIISSQNIKISASWDQNKGDLKQEFFDKNGKRQVRTWLISLHKDGTFDAIGHDALARALGRQKGNSGQMVYNLLLKEDGLKKKVKFDDKMYLVDKDSMIMISKSSSSFGSYDETITSLSKKSKAKASKKIRHHPRPHPIRRHYTHHPKGHEAPHRKYPAPHEEKALE